MCEEISQLLSSPHPLKKKKKMFSPCSLLSLSQSRLPKHFGEKRPGHLIEVRGGVCVCVCVFPKFKIYYPLQQILWNIQPWLLPDAKQKGKTKAMVQGASGTEGEQSLSKDSQPYVLTTGNRNKLPGPWYQVSPLCQREEHTFKLLLE